MIKEGLGVSPAEDFDDIRRLSGFLEGISERYRAEGVPVGKDGRIDMAQYEDFYSDVAKDLAKVKRVKDEWDRERQAEIPGHKRLDKGIDFGEQLEMLATAIFAKKFGERFIAVRASLFDDQVHQVDTVLLDRETGNLVCAFDEVGAASGYIYEEKLDPIQKKNLNGGANLKYGIVMKAENGRKRVIRRAAQNIPLFYIALPTDRIKRGVEEFTAQGISDYEEKLFQYFIAAIYAQIKKLELYRRLNPELKKNLTAFKDALSGEKPGRE